MSRSCLESGVWTWAEGWNIGDKENNKSWHCILEMRMERHGDKDFENLTHNLIMHLLSSFYSLLFYLQFIFSIFYFLYSPVESLSDTTGEKVERQTSASQNKCVCRIVGCMRLCFYRVENGLFVKSDVLMLFMFKVLTLRKCSTRNIFYSAFQLFSHSSSSFVLFLFHFSFLFSGRMKWFFLSMNFLAWRQHFLSTGLISNILIPTL